MRGVRAIAAVAVASATVAYPRYASPRCQPCSIFTNRAPPRQKLQARATITDIHRLTVMSAAASEVQESKMQLPRHPMVVKCACIAFCACFGTLVRLYTDNIEPSNLALQGSFLSNSIGSFALGVLEASDLNEERLGGLYTGLTVGLCGSYTTFSGWKLQAGRMALGDTQGNTDGIVAVVYIVESLAFFAACYIAGRDLVKALSAQGRWRCRARGGGGSAGGGWRGTTARAALAGIGSLYAILAVLLYVDKNWTRRTYWVASMFAPLGALLRYYLSKQFNQRWQNGAFPLGTYLANISGSLAIALVFYGATEAALSGWSGIVLKGFQGGFLGSLTTMSTFMKEVVGHRESHGVTRSYLYLAATVVTALALVLIIGAVLG